MHVAVTVLLVSAVVLAGAAAMIVLGRVFAARTSDRGNPYTAMALRYQPIALAIGVAAVLLVQLVVPGHADFLAVGDWSAPASGLAWLGVADGDSWLSVGLTFLVIMTLVTSVVVWRQVARALTWAALVRALPWALAFSATNAVAEELLFRATVTQGLAPFLPLAGIAFVSAVLFGLPHWWGSPGGLAGVVLAGFMGAFLAIAVVQTGGLGWAVVIHYAQDVVIITVLVARGALSSARLAE